MLKNNLLLAFRHFRKRKFYALLTLLSLTVSLAFTELIIDFVWQQWQVNGELHQAPQQYILRSQWTQPGMGYEDATLAPLAKALATDYPDLVANFYRFDAITTAVSVGNHHFIREVAQMGDPTLFTMFGFTLLYGQASTALRAPNALVITETNALRYFGRTDVLGRVVQLTNYEGKKQDFVITGVLAKPAKNSVTYLWDTPVDLFIPFNSLKGRSNPEDWAVNNFTSFLQLQPGVQRQDLDRPIQHLLAKHTPVAIQNNLHPFLTRLTDYYRNFNQGIISKTVYTLSLITLFVLMMALINLANLALSNAADRVLETGVRKAMGSGKAQLVGQHLVESLLLALLAFILSLLLYEVSRSWFSTVLESPLESILEFSAMKAGSALLLSLFMGLLAGWYPAFKLAQGPVIESLKGRFGSIQQGILFRRLLITIQFTVALTVFWGALLVSQQLSYLFTQEAGYNKEEIVLVSLPRDWTKEGVARMTTISQELARLPQVKAVSLSSTTLKGGAGYIMPLFGAGKDSTQAVPTFLIQADESFLQTYQIPLLAGRYYTSGQSNDELVLNESASKALGFSRPQQAISRPIYTQGSSKPITIIGVTKDFAFHSLRDKIQPTAIGHVNGGGYLFTYFSIKLQTDNLPQAIAKLDERFRQLLPQEPFDYGFADEAVQQLYQHELRLEKASRIATLLAMLIIGIGVVGLVSVSMVRRAKEMAIRKVLGASVSRLARLFMQEFISTMLLAMLMALPLLYWLGQSWLQGFAYHVTINWLLVISIGLIFLIGIVILIGFQTWQLTRSNPVNALRDE